MKDNIMNRSLIMFIECGTKQCGPCHYLIDSYKSMHGTHCTLFSEKLFKKERCSLCIAAEEALKRAFQPF